MMRRCLVAVMLVGVAIPAAAQGVFDMGMLTNTLSIDHNTQTERNRADAGRKVVETAPLSIAVGRSLEGSGYSASAQRGNLATSFTPSKQVRERNFAQFVAKARAVDPKAAADLEKTFATRDVIAEIGLGIAPFGLRTDDVVDASAAYLTTAWYGAQGRDDTPTQAQVDGVRAQMASAIATTAQFATATPAMKQELTEALLVQAMLVGQAASYVKVKPDLRAKVAAAIAQGARATFGFDLRRMALSENGLRPR